MTLRYLLSTLSSQGWLLDCQAYSGTKEMALLFEKQYKLQAFQLIPEGHSPNLKFRAQNHHTC